MTIMEKLEWNEINQLIPVYWVSLADVPLGCDSGITADTCMEFIADPIQQQLICLNSKMDLHW